MVRIKGSLEVANSILEKIMLDESLKDMDVVVETFDNFREQGYRLVLNDQNFNTHTIAFSEHRSSDDIVIYFSNKHECGRFGYSDDFWSSHVYFRNHEQKEAVKFIVDKLFEMHNFQA